jgi:hypothetical protein
MNQIQRFYLLTVIPAKAGIQRLVFYSFWIPGTQYTRQLLLRCSTAYIHVGVALLAGQALKPGMTYQVLSFDRHSGPRSGIQCFVFFSITP